MSRNEVKSLNDLAMAHGGQLTINPQTGLPEAGFLSAILPMVAGAALNVALPGSGMLVPALVGGASMLMNPKAGLMGGLMAGMGAYGGMNLGSALAESGMQQAGAEELAKSQAGISNVVGNAGTQGLPAGVSADQYAKNVLAQTQPYVDARTAAQTAFDTGSFTDRLGTMGQGAKTLASPGGFSNLYQNLGNSPMSRLGTVAALASPALTQQAEQPPAPVADKDMGQRYTYSPGVAKPIPAPDVPTYDQMLTQQGNFGSQQTYFPDARYEKISAEQAKNIYGFAGGGPVEQMSNNNAIGANTGFPQAYLHNNAYATPYQTPISQNVLTGAGDTAVDPYTGEQKMAGGGISGSGNLDLSIPLDFGGAGGGGGFGGAGVNGYSAVGSGGGSQTGFTGQNNTAIGAKGGAGSSPLFNTGQTPFDNTIEGDTFQPQGTRAFGGNPQQMIGLLSSLMQGQQSGNASAQQPMQMATGGISDAGYNLGGYSDGGRLLRGPGDGVSDSIPAVIGKKQPARLADGEFVVPARIVSEIGNGSTEAGARKLYGMMDRVQAARGKTVGKGKVARNTRADKYLPA
jgi:hypothetical protein